jgi:hypothetical protein
MDIITHTIITMDIMDITTTIMQEITEATTTHQLTEAQEDHQDIKLVQRVIRT